jgi:hypothetical protein
VGSSTDPTQGRQLEWGRGPAAVAREYVSRPRRAGPRGTAGVCIRGCVSGMKACEDASAWVGWRGIESQSVAVQVLLSAELLMIAVSGVNKEAENADFGSLRTGPVLYSAINHRSVRADSVHEQCGGVEERGGQTKLLDSHCNAGVE